MLPVTPVLRSPSADYVYVKQWIAKQWIAKVIGSYGWERFSGE
jgi:hypothetical protein